MNLVLCGAGKRGRELYLFLKHFWEIKEKGRVIYFIDNNSLIREIEGLPVYLPEKLENNESEIFYIITPAKDEIIKFYELKLQDKKYIVYRDLVYLAQFLQMDLTTIQRDACAYWHLNNMDWYFDDAESKNKISIFWEENSVFKKLFNCLDLTNVIELACGRGRHVEQYVESSMHVTIVDILQKNIDFCKNRFKKNNKISYYKNNGYNLEHLPSDSYTALFCYDSMVHFEMMDIYSYLVDIYRVIKRGGRVLLHHSNLDAFCNKSSFYNNFHGRTFMNYKIFAYMSIHAGFKVIKQEIIQWENVLNLDCITLLEKE